MGKKTDSMVQVETTIPQSWKDKIDKQREQQAIRTTRQWLRDLIYEHFIKEGK